MKSRQSKIASNISNTNKQNVKLKEVKEEKEYVCFLVLFNYFKVLKTSPMNKNKWTIVYPLLFAILITHLNIMKSGRQKSLS